MVGDSLHTDILGGAAYGVKTVLVTEHGLFSGFDCRQFIMETKIVPDFIIPTI
jgi:ribonucleotide monophosphatase NagD (HAD superfamily)